jgi:polygalacturonase
VLVQNCDIDCNDDDFCLKAGRDWDGLRVNRPTEYVLIRKCIARKGGGLLTIGSETSGSIRHVVATDLYAKGTSNGFQIKSATTRGGTVEDIHFKNITMDSVGNAFLYTMNWNPSYSYSKLPEGYTQETLPAHWKVMLTKVEPEEKGIPRFKGIFVSDVKVNHARRGIVATGLDRSSLDNFNFENVTMNADNAGEIGYAANWTLKSVNIRTADKSMISVKNSNGVNL